MAAVEVVAGYTPPVEVGRLTLIAAAEEGKQTPAPEGILAEFGRVAVEGRLRCILRF